jgi:hypothetical protein
VVVFLQQSFEVVLDKSQIGYFGFYNVPYPGAGSDSQLLFLQIFPNNATVPVKGHQGIFDNHPAVERMCRTKHPQSPWIFHKVDNLRFRGGLNEILGVIAKSAGPVPENALANPALEPDIAPSVKALSMILKVVANATLK